MILKLPDLDYPEYATKDMLLELVGHNRPPKEYVVEQLAEAAGRKVIRLPPYHSTLNPIELIWAYIKVA